MLFDDLTVVVAPRNGLECPPSIMVIGDVDRASCARLEAGLCEAAALVPGASLTVDLAHVTSIDPSGATALLQGVAAMAQGRMFTAVCNASPATQHVLAGATDWANLVVGATHNRCPPALPSGRTSSPTKPTTESRQGHGP